jgi:hypothetical protein
MAKYFCGITAGENKYTVSILDDNLNVIFIDRLELNKLAELLRRKSISIISIICFVIAVNENPPFYL